MAPSRAAGGRESAVKEEGSPRRVERGPSDPPPDMTGPAARARLGPSLTGVRPRLRARGAPGDREEHPRIFQDRSGRAGASSPSPCRPGHDAAVRGLQKMPQARHQEHSTASRDVTPGARDHERKGGMGISGRPAPGLRTEDARSFVLRCTHPIRGAAPLVTAYS